MENQDTDKSLFDITFDNNVKQSLKGFATWAGIAAIFAITDTVLGFVTYFVTKNRIQTYRYEGFRDVQYESQRADNLLSLVIVGIISGFLFYFLNRFSTLTKRGIEGSNTGGVAEGLESLATYFKILGVVTIVVVILAVIGILAILGNGGRTV